MRVDSKNASCNHLSIMQAIKVAATVEKEGELHLTNLPLHPEQRVEVILLIEEEPQQIFSAPPSQVNEEEWRKLVETIRQSEPLLPTLDEAMAFSRGRP
jgi:hypothetical protein